MELVGVEGGMVNIIGDKNTFNFAKLNYSTDWEFWELKGERATSVESTDVFFYFSQIKQSTGRLVWQYKMERG